MIPHFIDPNPTRVDNPVVTDADLESFSKALRARGINPDTSAPACAPKPAPLFSVTEVEGAALRGVDVVEAAADPINKFNAARAGIKLAAWVARKLR